jgi:hypothetical protein
MLCQLNVDTFLFRDKVIDEIKAAIREWTQSTPEGRLFDTTHGYYIQAKDFAELNESNYNSLLPFLNKRGINGMEIVVNVSNKLIHEDTCFSEDDD